MATTDQEDDAAAQPELPAPHSSFDQEFEDEEPGSYLRELNLAPLFSAWASINLICALVVPAAAAAFDLSGDDLTPLRVIWLLVPVSSVLLAATVIWYGLSGFTRRSVAAIRFALLSSALCVLIYLGGMLFASSYPLFAPLHAP